jgi:hypothetical protein
MHDIRSSIELLVSIDLTTSDLEVLDRAAVATQRVRGFAAACDARITRRRDELRRAILQGRLDGNDTDRPGPEPPGDAPPGDGPPTVAPLPLVDDRRSPTETERVHARAGIGATFPRFEDALADGDLDQEHLDALTTAWRMLAADDQTEAREQFLAEADRLLDHARVERPDRFRRRCRDLARALLTDHGIRLLERQRRESSFRRWFDKRTGMHHTSVTLDPERGALFDAVIDGWGASLRATEATSGLPWQELQVEAFCRVVGISPAGGAPVRTSGSTRCETTETLHEDEFAAVEASGWPIDEPVRPAGTGTAPTIELSVLVDLETLTEGIFRTDSICETSSGIPLPPATVRRMACEADLLPVVLGGKGLPLDVGRSRRLATWQQRRALRSVHRTCAHPNCDRPFDQCRIHHVDWWERGGATDLQNLLPVCHHHHHALHEGGWTVVVHEDRSTTWYPPGHQHVVPDRSGDAGEHRRPDDGDRYPVGAHPTG